MIYDPRAEGDQHSYVYDWPEPDPDDHGMGCFAGIVLLVMILVGSLKW